MAAIELLAFGPLSAPQVAHGLQVHPRTARRLLNRLVEDGYLARTEGERRVYAPTMRIVALAGQIVERSQLARVAVAHVQRLSEQTGLTAHLDVPSYRSVLCLVHGSGDAPARPQLRELVPCHCTAGGKVLLAHREPWRQSVVDRPLERHTDRTLVDPAALTAEATKVRERGFAIEDREYRTDMRGVAAPVRDRAGDVPAALVVSGPVEALPGEQLPALGIVIRDAAAALSRALSCPDEDADDYPGGAATATSARNSRRWRSTVAR